MELRDFEQLCRESLPAAYEVCRKLGQGRTKLPIPSAEKVYRYMEAHHRGLAQEQVTVLLLDTKHRLLDEAVVSLGTVGSSVVHPREVFKRALSTDGCAAIVLAHNHPSGDAEPSPEDIEMTRRMHKAGRLLGIPLIDHVVCGHGCWVSLRERTGAFVDE